MKNYWERFGFLLFIFSSLISCFFFVCLKRLEDKNDLVQVREYQYFEKDYLHNTTSLGFVSLFNNISTLSKDYISYFDHERRKEILISPFGTERYECFGTCYCVDSRRNSDVLIRGVSYLLAAVSSIVAMNEARKFFSERCQEQYSNFCETKSIQSEVDKCESIDNNDIREEGKSVGEKRTYFCYGNCMERKNKHTNKFRPESSEEGIYCGKLRREGRMKIDSNNLLSKSSSRMHISARMLYTARKRFQKEYLVDFCREQSKVEYVYQYSVFRKEKQKHYEYEKQRTGYVCTGVSSSDSDGIRKSLLRNVKCIQIEPSPKTRNAVYWKKNWWEAKRKWDETDGVDWDDSIEYLK